MEAAFEKIFYISSELLRMQEFLGFTNYVHQLAKCADKDCVIDGFLKRIREVIFNEELSYDQRRFFLQTYVILIYQYLTQCSNFTIGVRKI